MLWQAHAGGLWARFTTTLRRTLASQLEIRVRDFRDHARLSYAKVAEYQRRGLVHFHAVIHLAARTGATTKDLMARMGHDDMRAALIYQHATGEADRQIAERLSGLVDEHNSTAPDDDDGNAGALVRWADRT